MVHVEKEDEWVLPANMKRAAKDGTGLYETHQAYASGTDTSRIEPHAIADLDYARLYVRGLSGALRRRKIALSGQILDVGCALGTITQALRETAGDAATCSGIDLSAPLIDWATRRWPDCKFLVCSADELDTFGDNTLDIVHVREFYPFTRSASVEFHWQMLDEFAEKLRPGGVVAVVQIIEKNGMADSFADLKHNAQKHGFDVVERDVLVPQRLLRFFGNMAYWRGVYDLIAAAGKILERLQPGRVSYMYIFRKSR